MENPKLKISMMFDKKTKKHFYLVDDSVLPAGTKSRASVQTIKKLIPSSKKIIHIHATFAPKGYGQIAFAYSISKLKGVVGHIHTMPYTDEGSRKLLQKTLSFGGELSEKMNLDEEYENFTESATYVHTYNLPKIYMIYDLLDKRDIIYGQPSLFIGNGLDHPLFVEILTKQIKKAIPKEYKFLFEEKNRTMWVATSTTTILRSLYPNFKGNFAGVRTGMTVDEKYLKKNTKIYKYPSSFYENTKEPPPYNSLLNYDAKVFYFWRRYGKDGDVIWNVAGEI